MKIILFCLLLGCINAIAEPLKPSFDMKEYEEMLRIGSTFHSKAIDSIYRCPEPEHHTYLYKSPIVGFDNAWELWKSDNGVIVISLRASVPTGLSWGANFHAAMIPAKGTCTLGKTINYNFASLPEATVHAGWAVGTLALQDDVFHKIDSCLAAGHRDFILTGHSQGGAICYLMTSLVWQARDNGRFPADMRIKSYCSAAPKPGNDQFALYYEHLTAGGWSFNVVNPDDWVPQFPLSIQSFDDVVPTSPFSQIDQLIDKLGTKGGWKIKYLVNSIQKPTKKAQKNWTKYLGTTMGEMLAEQVTDYKLPEFVECANFQRCGTTIVLMTNEEYYAKHPHAANDAFEHHMYKAYYDLIK